MDDCSRLAAAEAALLGASVSPLGDAATVAVVPVPRPDGGSWGAIEIRAREYSFRLAYDPDAHNLTLIEESLTFLGVRLLGSVVVTASGWRSVRRTRRLIEKHQHR